MRTNVIAHVGQAFFKNGVGNCSQKQCVGTWADGQPFIAMFCCLALARVDYYQLATALAHCFKTTWEVWCRAQASIRVVWVGTQHQYVLRAIQIGNGNGSRRAKHVTRTHLLWNLIDRRRTEALLGTKCLQPHAVVNEWSQVVCVWVS